MTVGKKYFIDAKTIDMWGTIGDYKGDVYIVHGDEDNVVPIDNSYKAMEIYDHCDLTVLPGLGHGFTGDDLKTCLLYTSFPGWKGDICLPPAVLHPGTSQVDSYG